MNKKENILFGYSCTPSCGAYEEDDGGFSIEIDYDGNVVYKTYLFDLIEKTKQAYHLSQETTDKIAQILNKNESIIEKLDNHLDNNSCDGDYNKFILSDKEITAWNISYTDIPLLTITNPKYCKEYFSNIKQENSVIKIFNSIAKELSSEGITLTLHNAVINLIENK